MSSWDLRKFRQKNPPPVEQPKTITEDVSTMNRVDSPSEGIAASHLNKANDHLRDHRGHKVDQSAYAYEAGAHMTSGDQALSASYQRLADLHGQLADAHLGAHSDHKDRYLQQINNTSGTDGPANITNPGTTLR